VRNIFAELDSILRDIMRINHANDAS